jgi:hypothetical protein
MKFVLFHGAFGSPKNHWLPDLKEKLEMLNQEVIAPQFPVDTWDDITNAGQLSHPKFQTLEHWHKTFDDIKK